jgi:hypothetical protein
VPLVLGFVPQPNLQRLLAVSLTLSFVPNSTYNKIFYSLFANPEALLNAAFARGIAKLKNTRKTPGALQ